MRPQLHDIQQLEEMDKVRWPISVCGFSVDDLQILDDPSCTSSELRIRLTTFRRFWLSERYFEVPVSSWIFVRDKD